MSNVPVGTVGAAPLIVVGPEDGACVDAVCCCGGGCSAGAFFAAGLALAVAVCLAGWSFFSVGLVLAVLVGFAFGAGAAVSELVEEPPSPTMLFMRSIMPPPDELPLDENILPNKLPPDDCTEAVCVVGSETLPVAVRVVARSPLGGVRMLAGIVPAEVATRLRITPASSTLYVLTAEAKVGCMPPSAKLRGADRPPRLTRAAICASSRCCLVRTAATTSSGDVKAGQAAVET